MKKVVLIISIFLFFPVLLVSQLQIDWQQSFGGMNNDKAYDIVQSNKGFLVVGSALSSGGQVNCNSSGGSTTWLLKINDSGVLQWQKCMSDKYLRRLVNVSGKPEYYMIGGAYADPYPNTSNLCIVKMDSAGNTIWEQVLGNSSGVLDGDEYGEATSDGGIVATGQIFSQGGDVTNWYGGYDGWVVKLDSLGNKEWDYSIGSSQFEFINSIIQTSDEGYLVGLYGTPNGIGGNIDCDIQSFSNPDAIIFKSDSIGNPQWHHCYGGMGHEGVVNMIETEDGYMIAAFGGSEDGDLTGSGWHGGTDVWLIRTDLLGNIIWQKCYGGSNNDSPKKIFQTLDGGFVVFANTKSFNGDVIGNPSNSPDWPSIWVFKINSSGEMIWQQCIGGGKVERVYGVVKHSDYKYTVAGEMTYSPSGDVNCSNYVYGSQSNYWTFGISDTTVNLSEPFLVNDQVNIYPNPATSVLNIDIPLDFKTQNLVVEIFDINGRSIMTLKPASSSIQFNIKHLNKGLYLVKIQSENSFVSKKVLLQ